MDNKFTKGKKLPSKFEVQDVEHDPPQLEEPPSTSRVEEAGKHPPTDEPTTSGTLSESDKRQLFYEMCKKVLLEKRNEYGRKLGLNDWIVAKHKDDFYLMLNYWFQVIGPSTASLKNIYDSVEREVAGHTRSKEVDEFFKAHAEEKIQNARDCAWFIYSFISQYHDDDFWWKDVARNALKITDHKLTSIKQDNAGNYAEQQYRVVQDWMLRNNFESVDDMKKRLIDLNLKIPSSYYEQPTAIKPDLETPCEDASNTSANKQNDSLVQASTSSHSNPQPSTHQIPEKVKKILGKLKQPELKLAILGLSEDVPVVNPKTFIIEFYKLPEEEVAWQLSHQLMSDDKSDQLIGFDEIAETVMKNRVTGIVGSPGSGKTTLLIRLSASLSESDDKVSLHLKFHEMNYEDMKMTLRQLLIDYQHPELSDEECKVLFEWIVNNPDKCHIGLDAGDQATWRLDEVKPVKVPINTPLRVDQLIANVFYGEFLRGAHISVTSRPHTFITWPEKMRPQKFIQVRELSQPGMKELFKGFAAKKAEKLWNTLERKSPRLFSLCQIPIMLQLILLAFLGIKDSSTIQTVTQVFTILLEDYCRCNLNEADRIDSLKDRLSKLAYNATKQRTVIITLHELTREGLSVKDVQALIIAIPSHKRFTRKLLEGDKQLIFTHQLFQEYHAANYISQYMSMEEFSEVVEEVVTDPHWAMVRRFLCGLLLGGNYQVPLYPGHENLDKADKFYFQLLKQFQQSRREELLNLIVDLQESNDAVLHSFAKHFPADANFSGLPIGASESHALAQILKHVEKYIEVLNLSSCKLSYQSLEHICDIFGDKKIKMQELDLSVNQISLKSAEKISSIIENIESLELMDCNLSEESIEVICNAISEKKCKMQKLDLSGNQISLKAVVKISSIIENIESLELRKCNLSEDSTEVICNAISEKKCKKLDLSRNQISLKAAEKIASNIENFESLWLMGCNLSEESTEVICNAISEKKCKMQRLDLSRNQISLHHAEKISSNIENIESLVLRNCKLSEESIEVICNAISENKCKMQKLDLSFNQISLKAVEKIASNIENIESLWLMECKLSEESIEVICNAISEKKCKMQELDLSRNKISLKAAEKISSVIENIESLGLESCVITEEGEEVIRSKLRELGLPMERLRLSRRISIVRNQFFRWEG